MLESVFQRKLIKRIETMFPDCMVLKNDPNYITGIPDLTIIWNDRWATLEVKKSKAAAEDPEPNQEWYVEKHNSMSFSAFIYPENEDEVLDALQQSFLSR